MIRRMSAVKAIGARVERIGARVEIIGAKVGLIGVRVKATVNSGVDLKNQFFTLKSLSSPSALCTSNTLSSALFNTNALPNALMNHKHFTSSNTPNSHFTSNPLCTLQRAGMKTYVTPGAPLSKAQVQQRVIDVFRAFDKVAKQNLSLQANVTSDLGLDSLDMVEVTIAVEEDFNLEIPDAVAETFRTPSDIVHFMYSQCGDADVPAEERTEH